MAWVSSIKVSDIFNVNRKSIEKSAMRASKKGKNFCLIGSHICYFSYINGRGHAGKVLQIWIDDSLLANSGVCQEGVIDERGVDDVRDRNSIEGNREGAGSSHNRAVGDEFEGVISTSCREAIREAQSTTIGSGNRSARDSGQHKKAHKGNVVLSELAGASSSSATSSQLIKDLEKMHRVQAVNEMSACPATFKKTIWVEQVARKYGVSAKTLYGWAKILKAGEQVRVSVEGKRDFYINFGSSAFDKDALEWAVAWWLHNPLASKTKIYEELVQESAIKGWKIGAYQSFARIMNEPEIKVALMRAVEGQRGIRNNIAPYAMRDLDSLGAMEWIVGDQIVFDYTVYDDDGVAVNPNAYVWVDMSTSMIVGVDVVLGKYNRYSVGRSLKMALGYGVPDAIYTDNGKPELSNYLADIRSQLSGIRWRDFDELDPTLMHKKAKPRNSRAKPIEGIFNHIQRWLFESIAHEQGGFGYRKYTKTNHDEWVKEKERLAKKNSLLMDYKYFIEMFAKAIDRWNTHKIGNGRNIVPFEAFEERLREAGRSRFDEATLDYIFMPRKLLQVRNSWVQMTIAGEKRTYSHPALARYVGEKVEVRWDEANIESVTVSSANHEFIAHAHLVEKIDPKNKVALLRALERSREVEKAVEEAFKHYKSLYHPSYRLNAYVAPANDAKITDKEVKRINKKIAMSNQELLDAM